MKEIALPTTNFAENAVMTVSRVSAVSWCSARSIYRKGERRTMMKMENEMNVNVPLEIIKASEIEPKEVKWLWYPYIPFGKVTLLQGDPGDGKSKLMLSIAALLSKGEPLPFTEEETEQKLASLLDEKSSTVEDKFTETDITYPVIESDGKWKIVALDADTVRVMSANFTNVQDEIDQSLADLNNPDATVENTTPSSTTSIDMENDHFTLRLTQFRIAQEIDDSDCLMLYCDYTNNSSSTSSALVDVQLSASQNGEKLSPAVPKEDDPAINNYIAEVEPGKTVTICYAFSLNDKSDVTLEASEAFAFGDGNVTSQTIKLQ